MKLWNGFLIFVKILWAVLVDKVNGPQTDDTQSQEAVILKNQRDSQITTVQEADQWQDAHTKEF